MPILREHHARYLLTALALMLGACAKKQAPPPPPPPVVKVTTLAAERESHDRSARAHGAFKWPTSARRSAAWCRSACSSRAATSSKGSSSTRSIPRCIQAAYESAAASAESSRLQAERYKPLAEANAVSKQDYDNAVAAAAQSKASADTAQINLVYTRLLSPIPVASDAPPSPKGRW
jgi:membrane fusion protein (multidrug efflux system)